MTVRQVLSTSLSVKLAELKEKSYLVLQAMPKNCEVAITGVKGGGLSIWIDQCEDQTLRITAQAYKKYFLGLGVSQLGGFSVSIDGNVTDLKPSELD